MHLHNKFSKQLLILLIIFFCINITYSQDLVTVNIQQPPLNQLRIEHLWKITLNNTSPDVLNVYLYGTLIEQKDGIVLKAKTSSINLSPGLKNVNVHELEPISVDYPNSDSKYREALVRTGNLPSGDYEICVYVRYKINNNNCGSDCIQHSIEIIPAPVLISPYDNEYVVTRPLFTWMQAVRPGLDIRYKIKIVEIKNKQSPETSMQKNPAWFEESNIMANIFQYPVSASEFADSGRFAWQIQAIDFSGNPLGENNGLSEIMSFIYTGKSIDPNVDVIAFPNDIDVLYPKAGEEMDADAISFQWSYKKQSDSNPSYSIKIVEVLENQTLQVAIKENAAIWEWANVLDTFFIFTETDKEFVPGKEYAWQVSIFEGGNQVDECEISSFIIFSKKEPELDVLYPKVSEEIDADGLILEWENYAWKDSSIRYSLKIVEVNEDQTPEIAIDNNESYFEKSDLESPKYMLYRNSYIGFDAGKKYAWRITVYKGGEIVGTSNVGSFIIKPDNE